MRWPLSFLDLTPIPPGGDAADALRLATELAQEAERLGFARYWFAEHHNMPGLASAVPEVMIAHVAARTGRIRVGSGGVMLPNHAPLRVAEAFRLLEALHPGRIDLGLGRAPGTDTVTALAMRRSRAALTADDYPELLAELLALDGGGFPPGHPFGSVRPVPVDGRLPPVWLLGSSDFSARMAAETGMAFAFAAHISRAGAVPALRDYRSRFVPSARWPGPRAMLTVSVTVGETAAHAAQLARVGDLVLLRLRSGRPGRYPSLAEALAYPWSDAERALLATMPLNAFVGDAATVHEQVAALAEATGADEIMLTTMMPEPGDRRRALVRLAELFGLPGAVATPFV